jgi:DNA (cytosine-5)-methyltransferase 1
MTAKHKAVSVMKNKRTEKAKREISAVDLFCGVGGLTHGLVQGGISVAAGIDIDEDCHFPYEANNKALFLERDIQQLTANDIAPLFEKGKIRLLAGCAPCQPFSTYSQPGRADRSDGNCLRNSVA